MLCSLVFWVSINLPKFLEITSLALEQTNDISMTRFRFKMRFRRISYIAQGPSITSMNNKAEESAKDARYNHKSTEYITPLSLWNMMCIVNLLRLRQNGCHFAYDHSNAFSSMTMLEFRLKINIIPALVQIMTWRRPGDKPLPEPLMFSLLTHICVTRPQWIIDPCPSVVSDLSHH